MDSNVRAAAGERDLVLRVDKDGLCVAYVGDELVGVLSDLSLEIKKDGVSRGSVRFVNYNGRGDRSLKLLGKVPWLRVEEVAG